MILITRPQPDADHWAQELERRGHACIVHPLTTIRPLPDAAAAIRAAITSPTDAIIITSLQILHLGFLSEIPAAQPIYCLSAATAEKISALGFNHIIHAEGDVQSLASLIRQHAPPSVLYLRGKHISSDLRPLLPDTLLTEITCYEATAIDTFSPSLTVQLRQGDIRAVTFFSRRTAEIYMHLAGQANIAPISAHMDCFCLSEHIAQAAAALPWKRFIISPKPAASSLTEAIDIAYPPD